MDRRCNIAVGEIFPRARVTTREDYICLARSPPEEPKVFLRSHGKRTASQIRQMKIDEVKSRPLKAARK